MQQHFFINFLPTALKEINLAKIISLGLAILVLTSCADYSSQQLIPNSSLSENDLDSKDGEDELSEDVFSKFPKKNLRDSSLSLIAKWVINNESKQVGPYCNFFVQRVLQIKGYGLFRWRANEFDEIAPSQFSNYKVESFVSHQDESERVRFKEYIWSYPEKTDFVLQWKRPSKHGHIAILQRIGEKLVIYHASLNSFYPKSQQAKIEVLLSASMGSKYRLNVYSDFKKKHVL